MRVKVIRKFKDKYTGEYYSKGDVIDISEERYSEIMSVGQFVYKIGNNDDENNRSEDSNSLPDNVEETLTSDSEQSDDGFEDMNVRELKEYADKTYKLTFKAGTKKSEIIETLRRMEHGE